MRSEIFSLIGVSILSGCVTASVEQLRMRPAAQVTGSEWIVVLGRGNAEYQTERDVTECVRDSLAAGQRLNVMDESSFVDRMFPWFEPRTAPVDANDLAERLSDRAVARRLEETRIRYIVWLDGLTRDGDKGGGISCAIGPGGGGCLGLLWWEKSAEYEAAVWDVAKLESMGKITIDASGTSYVPAVIIPVPLIARTQASACSSLAAQLGEFLTPAAAGPPADGIPRPPSARRP